MFLKSQVCHCPPTEILCILDNMADFKIVSDFTPQGDQPQAIAELVRGLNGGEKYQTLLGVTGSGKTYTMANVIQEVQRIFWLSLPLFRLAGYLLEMR